VSPTERETPPAVSPRAVSLQAGFFKLLDVPVGEEPAGTLRAILDTELHGIVVRGVVPEQVAERSASRAERDPSALPAGLVPSRQHLTSAYGPLLHEADATQARYLTLVDAARATFDALFAPERVDELLLGVLARAAAPLTVDNARAVDGARYGTATLRCIPPGGSIPVHAEDLQLGRPGYDGLRDRVGSSLLSVYLVLRPAEVEGRLRIHDVRLDGRAGFALEGDGGALATEPSRDMDARLRTARFFEPELRAGDVIVFDAGRFFHQVTRVEGASRRWSYGGFLAREAGRPHLMLWS
jgi:hypothetical protein